MRIRLLVVAVSVSLLVLLIGLPTAQAQSQSIRKGDRFWRTESFADTLVTLCHVPPGKPGNAHTIELAQAAAAAHLAHGDTLGACPGEGDDCPEFLSAVPATGQTLCWGSDFPIDCAGTGQDGESQDGVSADPRFTENGDGTVTDNLTGVIWLQHANCIGLQNWATALSQVATLADGSCLLTDGSVAGDWRLPNVKELQSLIDFGQLSPTLPVGHPFYDVRNSVYWSSTTSTVFSNVALEVSLGVGTTTFIPKSAGGAVWAVRRSQ